MSDSSPDFHKKKNPNKTKKQTYNVQCKKRALIFYVGNERQDHITKIYLFKYNEHFTTKK